MGTTILDQNRYEKKVFSEIYHSRWGVEELYKTSKRCFIIEDFHAKSERGVKQEVFAHFALITMNRIFANQADINLNLNINDNVSLEGRPSNEWSSTTHKMSRIKTNFKNCIQVFARSIEELLLLHDKMKAAINHAFDFIMGRHQKKRPGRLYPRKSMRPINKWRPAKNKLKKKKQSEPLLNPVR